VAKRFTDTGKWKKKWIRELNPDMKLFWFYLLDNCDHAGIWEVDIDLASFQVGVKLDEARILKVFNRKIVPFKDGKWFVPKFIEYQYGELNEANRAHSSVIKILTKYGLYKGLARGLQGAKDKDKDKDKDKREGKFEIIEKSLDGLQAQFKNRNVESEFQHFKDYCKANGKKYKNHLAAFRNWLRNENYRSKDEPVKQSKIVLSCPKGHHKRKVNRGVSGVCPECYEQLVPIEQIQIERAIA
jgi:hypothetical protein